jgi:hypothetical protein
MAELDRHKKSFTELTLTVSHSVFADETSFSREHEFTPPLMFPLQSPMNFYGFFVMIHVKNLRPVLSEKSW